jgi:hypothetical protein
MCAVGVCHEQVLEEWGREHGADGADGGAERMAAAETGGGVDDDHRRGGVTLSGSRKDSDEVLVGDPVEEPEAGRGSPELGEGRKVERHDAGPDRP